MKTLGLIGGTSWVSTLDYYKLLNEITNQKAGGSNAAKLLLYSFNWEDIRQLTTSDDWITIEKLFSDVAMKLQAAGAEAILLCANTAHKIADEIQQKISIPIIHIAEETAKEIKSKGLNKVGLLGTKFVMEQAFFKDKLSASGIEALIPTEEERNFIHQSIFTELTKNVFTSEAKKQYLIIINNLIRNGAQAIIFACTEIPILLKDESFSFPTFDTTHIHATAAVEFALKD
jgi:aspartate racemase